VTVDVKRKDGAPAMLVRAGEERDLPALVALHETRSANATFCASSQPVARPVRARQEAAARGAWPAGLRQIEFFVAEEGASAVAYVLLHENAHGWTLEEAGDRDSRRRAPRARYCRRSSPASLTPRRQ
jgi:hypothetical protein